MTRCVDSVVIYLAQLTEIDEMALPGGSGVGVKNGSGCCPLKPVLKFV